MAKPLLILLRMDDLNQPHMDNLRLMVLMVDYHIRMSMPKLNYENHSPPVTDLEDDEYKEGPGDDEPTEYLSEDEDVFDT